MKVFIQISVKYFYTASESFIQLFIPVSVNARTPATKMWKLAAVPYAEIDGK